jgi:hypothetical protein
MVGDSRDVQHLDGDIAIELQIVGEIDRGHAAHTDPPA